MEQGLTPKQIQYLVVIARLQQDGEIRPSELARGMNVRKSSVHSMVQQLEARALVVGRRYGAIRITEDGLRVARQYEDRLRVIRDCLCRRLALSEALAGISAMALLGGLENDALEALCAQLEAGEPAGGQTDA